MNKQAQPFLKWAGGKRQLIPEIMKYIPEDYGTYYEPFIGAGAVLFQLKPAKAIINDVNSELVNTYHVIRYQMEELIEDLKRHENTADYYYSIREWDRNRESYAQLTQVQKASRLIYLNKTCFNGLYRVNKKGQYNVPYGKYKSPNIVNEQVIRQVHEYLNEANVTIKNEDFAQVIEGAKKGDFIYLDPPYDPVSMTASFTNYSLEGFGKKEQLRLRDLFHELDKRGCFILLSNSATDFIKSSYDGYKMKIVGASRNINSIGSKRGKIEEVLVMNY
ncbi:adenine-specific DNA methyltransferase [Bacillus sp. TS-2]|nr:adenine-specific DNA methyltransferase [Bacillus sp. TS-2]